jgi:hypothetical protein
MVKAYRKKRTGIQLRRQNMAASRALGDARERADRAVEAEDFASRRGSRSSVASVE